MDGNALTDLADRAGQRYLILLTAFKSIFDQFAANANPGSDSNRKKASAKAYQLASGFIIEESQLISGTLLETARSAFVYTIDALGGMNSDIPDVIASHTAALAQDLEHNVRTQLERDISTIGKGLRDIALRAALISGSSTIRSSVALSNLRQNNSSALGFTFQDRGGRFWSSQKLVRTLYRQSFVLAWNEPALLTMALSGVASAVIAHPDASHSESGTVISLSEEIDGISWDEVRNTVFHPNSNAWVKVQTD
jgi:hypothetical protein